MGDDIGIRAAADDEEDGTPGADRLPIVDDYEADRRYDFRSYLDDPE